MNASKGSSIRSTVTLLATGAAALGSQLPGISFFTTYAPPDFGPLKLMTSGLTLALFVWVLRSTDQKQRLGASAGVKAVLAAIVLAVAYSALLDWTTVVAPPEQNVQRRFQIGFGLAPFSLTDTGLKVIKASKDTPTAEDLLLATGGFRPNGAEVAWKHWTVTASWALLCAIFLMAYIAWSFGLACVGRQLSAKRRDR